MPDDAGALVQGKMCLLLGMPTSAVIFDCDDTLIETAKTRWAALIEAALAFGVQLDESAIRVAWGQPFDTMIASLLPGLNLQEFVSHYREVMRHFPPRATPGAHALLDFLNKREVRLDVVTSSNRELIVQDLEELELTPFFTGIWGYEQTTPYQKPDSRVLSHILASLRTGEVSGDAIIYIGDSVRDLVVARGNGLPFIAVTTGLEDSKCFLSAGLSEKSIVASLNELLDRTA